MLLLFPLGNSSALDHVIVRATTFEPHCYGAYRSGTGNVNDRRQMCSCHSLSYGTDIVPWTFRGIFPNTIKPNRSAKRFKPQNDPRASHELWEFFKVSIIKISSEKFLHSKGRNFYFWEIDSKFRNLYRETATSFVFSGQGIA